MMKPAADTVICMVPVDCLPVGGVTFKPYKGSVQRACPGCGRMCWLGPESRRVHETLGVPLTCALCAALLAYKTGRAVGPIVPLTDKGMGE